MQYFIKPCIYGSESWGHTIRHLRCSTTRVAQLQTPHAFMFFILFLSLLQEIIGLST
jgi:hypothetical protein